MKAVLPLCLIVGLFAATESLASKYENVSIKQLGRIMADAEEIEKFNGKSIQVTGLIHGFASASVSLDLRPDASKYIGTDDESPTTEECVGLVAAPEISRRLKGHHIRTVFGKAFIFEKTEGLIGSARYQGVTFHPRCGYFNPKSLYILVEYIKP